MKITFSPPDISELEIEEVVDSLRSGWITTGPKTKHLETLISEYCGTKKSVCLNSATAAMELCLYYLGVGKGDEVITSAYTYTASASVIDHVGATIRLVDLAEADYEMDYEALEAAINEKTKVIIPVDIGGMPCDYEKIYEIIERKKDLFRPENEIQEAFGRIIVIADAAHSFGALYQGRPNGQHADFTCFSFHAVKNFTTSEGGAVTIPMDTVIDADDFYTQLQLLSLHGQNKDALAKMKLGSWEYDIIGTYYKCNLTDILASLGVAQMKRYPELLKRRHEIIEKYNEGFQGSKIHPMAHQTDQALSSGHLYITNIEGFTVDERNELIRMMAEKGIATNVHYKPLPMHTAYQKLGFSIEDYPNAYRRYENEVTLPLHTLLTDEEISVIIQSMKELVK